MANVNVTNIDLERDEGVDVSAVAFAVAASNTLTIVPPRPGRKLVLIIYADAAVNVTVAVGNYWYAKALGAVNVGAGVAKAFCFTPARYQTSTGLQATSGNIVVTIAAADGSMSAADTWMCFQLPDIDGRLPSESES